MITAAMLTIDCESLACQGGLKYVNCFEEGIIRRRCGRGFRYVLSSGSVVRSPALRNRIAELVIPPAWTEVWICPDADGHIQAVGRDELGRKQYIYHPKWHELSTATKFERMLLMPEALPRIRARVREDLTGVRLSRERVIAAVVRVLDKAHIRVGNEQYVKERDTRGATTLTSQHVQVDHFTVTLDFPGKSGKRSEVAFTDRKVAKVIRQCEEIEGHYLFSYLDESGQQVQATSSDVNAYLREVAGQPITAKDFRTWWGSVTALDALAQLDDCELSTTARKKALVGAVRQAASLLGNTLSVCRKSYIHPKILSSFEEGCLAAALKQCQRSACRPRRELQAAECRFAAWLKSQADARPRRRVPTPRH